MKQRDLPAPNAGRREPGVPPGVEHPPGAARDPRPGRSPAAGAPADADHAGFSHVYSNTSLDPAADADHAPVEAARFRADRSPAAGAPADAGDSPGDPRPDRGVNHGGKSAAGFARRVLTVVRRIPAGRVATYGDVAAAAGRPRAARAVGNVLRGCVEPGVPCHRVVGAGGRLGGYGDLGLKRSLLAAEGVRVAGGRLRRFAAVRWRGPRPA